MTEVSMGAPWASLLACLCICIVLLTSVQLKLSDHPSFVAWARSARHPLVQRMVEHAAIPIEIAIVLLLVAAGFSAQGALAATVLASAATLASMLSKRFMGDQRCACFGRASLAGLVSGTRVFGALSLGCAALAWSGGIDAMAVRLPLAAVMLAWLLVPIASSRLAARLQAKTYVMADGSNKTLAPELREMLAGHARSDDPALPWVILFTMKGCPPCRDIAAPFEEFARAFPRNARYFVFQRGGEREESVRDGIVHLSAANPDLPKTMGLSGYPCALRLEHGAASLEGKPYDNADGIRSLLATLIRPAPAGASAQREAVLSEPGPIARTPTPSVEQERAALAS
jgi:hypothetical protein